MCRYDERVENMSDDKPGANSLPKQKAFFSGRNPGGTLHFALHRESEPWGGKGKWLRFK